MDAPTSTLEGIVLTIEVMRVPDCPTSPVMGTVPIMLAPTWTLDGTVLTIEVISVPLWVTGTVPITDDPTVPETEGFHAPD